VPLLDHSPRWQLLVWCAGRVDGYLCAGAAAMVAIPDTGLLVHRLGELLAVGAMSVDPELIRVRIDLAVREVGEAVPAQKRWRGHR
jgi:hypothetical protein